MIEVSIVKQRLEEAFLGAVVVVENPQEDGEHFETTITFSGFAGKSLIEQHKMVYKALENEMKDIHALSINTKVE